MDETTASRPAKRIAGLTGLQVLGTGPDIAELARIVDEWPVGYVVVHLNWLSAERALNALAFMNAHSDGIGHIDPEDMEHGF
mgnify:CR=1 FL=1